MDDRLTKIENTRRTRPLIRAVAALLGAKADGTLYPEAVVTRNWPNDNDARLIVKAAVVPATMTTSAWAGSLASTALADFVMNMGPASAGSQLLSRGLQLTLGRNASIMVPGLLAAAANVGFVGEGLPIPVRQFSADAPTLTPRKFAVLTVFTRELFMHSTPTIEALVRNVLTESVGLSLDAALFDATEGDAVRPSGLRFGISAETASVLTPRSEAMAEDIAALIAAVAPIAGNHPIVLIANPEQAVALRMWNRAPLDYEVLATAGVAAKTVIAVATNALVSAIDPEPTIEPGDQGTVHMENTTPLAISSDGTPNTVAAPVRNMWQTDTLSLRLRFGVNWALRNSGGLAWLENVIW